MESIIIIKKSSEPSKNLTRITHKTITLIIFIILLTMVFASCLKASISAYQTERDETLAHTETPPLHPFIKNACINTLYPSLCFTTLSSIPPSANATTFHHILEISINQTVQFVSTTRFDIMNLSTFQDLNSQQKNALNDCLEMLDQTLYELSQAIDDLHASPAFIGHIHRSYGNLKTLLSAAMTNENTCIDGFSELEQGNSENQKGLKECLQNMLAPISHIISNCLAMVKYIEKINHDRIEPTNHGRILINKMPRAGLMFPEWMTPTDQRLMETVPNTWPDVIVASDGSGDYCLIGEAVRMAPNNSITRYVIKIKAGVYNENVEISREKVNIMLIGEGMNSTVITGSKSFADGFSTFTSATLTVVGDKFLARDLTIINTAGPEKHQAVALRVTSISAFYRCNFSSYQDTLYAHSLRQFYRECTIQGTIDFIFGNAAAVFQNCLILIRKPIPGQNNMITAQGREDPNQDTGISLQNCTIMAAPDFTIAERRNFSTFLGRPWRNYSRTLVMKSYLGDLIHPHGWHKWNKYSTLDTVEYIECMNFGHGADDWLESTGFPPSQGPSVNQELTWAPSK